MHLAMNETLVLRRLLELVELHLENQRSGRLVDYHEAAALSDLLDLERSSVHGDWQEIFDWVEKYFRYSVKTNHPLFVNRMWVGANLSSVVGEIVTAVSNTSACTFESAPVSTLMEKYMIRQMLHIAGFTSGEGQMTTGSSNANMIAMMAARNTAGGAVKREGLCGQRKLFAFASADSHYSLDKAANILAIGTDQLVKIPVNDRGEMVAGALADALERVAGVGGVPFFVAATAGTTVRGAYDPLEPLLALRDQYGFWLHVDGAWGGAVMLSDKLKSRFLPKIENVDSLTLDFHKMLGTSLMCNILLINSRVHTLGTVLSGGNGSYLFRDEHVNEVEDFGAISLQCGRRVDSLKWFLDWKFYGREGLGERVERHLELCEYAEAWITNCEDLELYVPRTSFNICFRFRVPEERSNTFNLELRTRLHREGISLVGIAYIGETLVIRLLIPNPEATHADIDSFFAAVVATGKELNSLSG